jgi:hypothetical protein
MRHTVVSPHHHTPYHQTTYHHATYCHTPCALYDEACPANYAEVCTVARAGGGESRLAQLLAAAHAEERVQLPAEALACLQAEVARQSPSAVAGVAGLLPADASLQVPEDDHPAAGTSACLIRAYHGSSYAFQGAYGVSRACTQLRIHIRITEFVSRACTQPDGAAPRDHCDAHCARTGAGSAAVDVQYLTGCW